MLKEEENQLIINRLKREPFFKMQNSHYHNAYEIYYLFSGSRKFFINDSIYNINKGDLVLISKGALHRTTYRSDKGHERMFIYFSDEYLKMLFKRYGKEDVVNCFNHPLTVIPLSHRDYIEDLLKKLENEFKNSDTYSPTLLQGYLNELIIFLIRYQKFCDTSSVEHIDKADEVIQQAARYILNNYNNAITLKAISEYVNMSSSYFSRRFKETTGFGFKEYLLNVRIKKASELLLEAKDPITDIAFKCGFNDSNYFGDVFKKVKGISPLQYRKNNEFI